VSDELRLKLFVAGDSPRARDAAAHLARACEGLGDVNALIDTIDILRDPAAADEYRVLTTPTVVRVSPAPRRRVTGDLRDVAQVLVALDLHYPRP
jgi:circadian clock protein KaiB